MTPVTAWIRWYPPEKHRDGSIKVPGYWTFNHIEDAHSSADVPADPFKRGWSRATWRKAHGHLGALGPLGAAVLTYPRDGLFD